MEIPRKYLALRWIGLIATVAAWLAVALSVVALVWVLANVGANWAQSLLIVLVVLWGVSTFLTLFVRGNVMLLLHDLEHQSRANAQAIDQMKSLLQNAKATPVQPSPTARDVTRIESKPTT